MKKLFLILTTALFAAGFASCTDDPEETVNPVVVSEILRALGGNVLVNVPEENFDVNIPADAASWVQINEAESSGKALVLSVDENETGTERSTVVNVTRSGKSTVLATVTIKQSDITLQAGEFVIEEIYFTGTALPETGKPDRWLGDQYIKIRNNSDEDLYADGESLIVVNNAQNHTIGNPNSWDATKADFEWYDVSSNENYLDIDNPDVPNLDKWYASTLTVQVLHNRGFNAVAIAMPPVGLTAEQFLAEYPLEDAQYIFHSPNGSDYTMPLRNCYRVPNEWVLDAVNTGCRDEYYIAPWDASLDAGYAWCGTADGDAYRFGKSVIRKTGSDGKLIDSNNSTNDFESNTKASLIK